MNDNYVRLKECNFLPTIARDGFGNMQGITLHFLPLKDHIYQKSNGQVVQQEIPVLIIDLNKRGLIDFTATLLDVISVYLYEHKKELYKITKKTIEDKYYRIDGQFKDKTKNDIYMNIKVDRHFFRPKDGNRLKGNVGKYKISIAFILKGDDNVPDIEIVEMKFTKSDILKIFNYIKELSNKEEQPFGFMFDGHYIEREYNTENNSENIIKDEYKVLTVLKRDNSILLGDTWLHGQELYNLAYIVFEMVYDKEFSKNIKTDNTYRQLKIKKDSLKLIDLIVTKFHKIDDDKSLSLQVFQNEDGIEYIKLCSLKVDRKLLAYLSLFVSMDILNHTSSYDQDTQFIKTPFKKLKYIKSHVNTRESNLGFGIRTKKDNNILFMEIINKNYEQLQRDFKDISILEAAYIPFNNKQYKQFMVGLSMGLTNSWKKALSENKNRAIYKFYTTHRDSEGLIRYFFEIEYDINNDVDIVLKITKSIRINNAQWKPVAFYRQPLYRKYVYQILSVFVSLLKSLDDIADNETLLKKDLIRYSYINNKKVIEGFSDKIYFSYKKQDKNSYLGIDGLNLIKLPFADQNLLYISMSNLLFRDNLLPFVGHEISLTQENFLISSFGILKLDKKDEKFNMVSFLKRVVSIISATGIK